MPEFVIQFGLLFARFFALFTVLPVLSSRQIPMRLRASFTIVICFMLLPVTQNFLSPLPVGLLTIILALLGQMLIGALVGFMIVIIISAFQIVGELISMQMGTSFAEILDPQANVSLPVLGILKNAIAFLIFVAVPFQMGDFYMPTLHHTLRVLAWSIEQIPYFHFAWQDTASVHGLESITLGGIIEYLNDSMRILFLISIQLGLPLIGILFISSLVLGLFGRAAPQFNLVNIGGQLNIGLGIIFMIILTPVLIPIVFASLAEMVGKLQTMFYHWPK